MDNYDCAPHENILEMFLFMTKYTSLNPPVLGTYTTAYSLIERRQFTDMIELANHILFLAQMQTQVDLPVKFKQSLGTVSCEAIPYGYRFRVVQWTTREQAFDQLASDTNNPAFRNAANPSDIILSGSRIQQGYTSCTPWAMNSYEGNFTFLTCLNSNKISAPPSARQTLKSTSTV
jgi:hypothetical protein